MERLPKTVPQTPPAVTSPSVCDKESYGCAGNQPSPIPGETASPASHFQHSPSLPASGLTEFSDRNSRTRDTSPGERQHLPAARRDLALTTSATQKPYVGVRVRMPVRELLKKIRLSKEIDSSNDKETSVKSGTNMTSAITEKKRAYSERRNKQNRKHTEAALKSVEDLDILVEVLEEDLNGSRSKPGFQLTLPRHQDSFTQFWPPWLEADGGPSSWEPAQFHPHGPFPSSGAFTHPHTENFDGCHCRTTQQHLDPSNICQHLCEEERHQQGNGAVVQSMATFQGFARDIAQPHSHNSSGHTVPEPLEDGVATTYGLRRLKPSARPFVRQDASAISFFQFQLCCEESWLRTISVDSLIAPDKNGNRLLHEAVMQGKRALTYALAWRFACLNRIDEKDAAKQLSLPSLESLKKFLLSVNQEVTYPDNERTALHLASEKNHHLIVSDLISLGANVNARDGLEKTPLHLCAEKGYLKVLEVLKNCQEGGIHVDVDATDNQGLTPLQRATLAHCTLLKALKKHSLSPEARRVQTLQKEQIRSGIDCLVQMGADPWVQEAKSSSQALNYFAKIQEDNELMSSFQTHRPKLQKDSSSLPGPEGMALLYLQGEDVEPPLSPFPGFLDHFPEGAV